MSLTLARTEVTRQSRDVANLFFVIAIPVVMLLIFGPLAASTAPSEVSGIVIFDVTVSMSLYAAATSMTALTGTVATEVAQGWLRQLGLSPLTPARFISTKVGVALFFSAIAVSIVLLTGNLIGAQPAEFSDWFASAALVLIGSTIFGLYGLAVGLLFRSDSAIGVASGLITLFAFFGNVFMPLSGTMLDIARFTPMYGVVGLARWPLHEGYVHSGDRTDELWMLLANIVGWAIIFGTGALLGLARSRGRK